VVAACPLASAASFGSSTVPAKPDVWSLCTSLFLGTFGREVWMDVTDVEGDGKCGIRTIPIVFGRRIGLIVGGVSLVLSALVPFMSLTMTGGGLLSSSSSRKSVVAATVAMVIMMRTAVKVVGGGGGGGDDGVVLKAIETSKGLPLVLILMSYFLK